MDAESFMNLVNENGGFEFVIGYKDFVDHRIGGQDNKYWYFIDYDSKKKEYYVGTYENGSWTDKYYTKRGKKLKSKTAKSGTTIQKIVDRAYFYQDKTVDRKPREVEKHGFICNHYVFGFGDVAVETVKEYGITVEFNDISDNDSAYHLRDILLGKDVEKPEEENQPVSSV